MTLGPDIFFKTRSSRARPYEQYRLNGESVVCERVTPNVRSPAPHRSSLYSPGQLTGSQPPTCLRRQTALQEYLREKHKA